MRRPARLPWVAFGLALVASACALAPSVQPPGDPPAPSIPPTGGVTLTLAAYSTPRDVFAEVIPAFQRTPDGAGVAFEQSFGASGEQSRAVEQGLAADVVVLSLEPDVTRLVTAGKVAADWNADAYAGIVSDSVVAFVVRQGNPKRITAWADLLGPGVEVLTPNPITSGGARWNVLAAYGAQLQQGRSRDQAAAYLRALFAHVVVQDKSARDALQTFLGGEGDVLISYENEAIAARKLNPQLEYVIPDQTILIESPAAVVASTPHPAQARAFLAYLRSPDAQRSFGRHGYRPVVKEILGEFRFASPPGLFTVKDLGGWHEVDQRLFAADTGLVPQIERGLGVQP